MDYEPENRTEEENEKIINEEYKMWKKNSPFLYNLVVTHALEWPSLTCQWFPDVEDVPDQDYKIQRLLLGTHTNDDEPNYLQIASVKLPKENKSEDAAMEDVNDEKESETFIKITQKILHDGEVNRARYQIENPDIIATKSRTGDVYVFDRTTFDPMPKENEKFNPTLRLTGHDKEGYGLAWSPHKHNSTHLLSAGFDSKICQWDITGSVKENRELEPIRTYTAHTNGVEDVAWHTRFESIFASVGDDAKLMIWDARNDTNKPVHNIQAHEAEVNCVAFAPGSEWILATGSGDKTAALWDLRNFKAPLHSLKAHQSEILQLAWSPHHEAVLATASSDRRILVWDLSRINDTQLPEETDDGPPELLFMHGGHTNKISDFGWNPVDPWVLSSTADDNIVQVWQMASNIHSFNQSNAQQQYEDEKMTETPLVSSSAAATALEDTKKGPLVKVEEKEYEKDTSIPAPAAPKTSDDSKLAPTAAVAATEALVNAVASNVNKNEESAATTESATNTKEASVETTDEDATNKAAPTATETPTTNSPSSPHSDKMEE